jgi:hypothetical protein
MMRLGVLGLSAAMMLANARQGDGIVRLKPGDFRQLPVVVRRDLERRGCRIPQLPEKPAPHNVIAGSFVSAGARDWAVLCSIRRESRVLVYRSGRASKVDSLGRLSDEDFLQDDASGARVFSRKLDVLTPKAIAARAKETAGAKPPSPIDHDGIDDIFSGKASIVRYLHRGRWLELEGAD